MYCYQCEQTAKGTGCTAFGVCGKSPEVADLQDLLLYVTQGVSKYAHRARALGAIDKDVDVFVTEALFTTITNVNFDEERIEALIRKAGQMRDRAKKLYEDACRKAGKTPETLGGPATVAIPATRDAMMTEAAKYGVAAGEEKWGEVVQGLRYLILLGLKGSAAYIDHAHVLGFDDDAIYGFFHDFLDYLTSESYTVDGLVGRAMDAGKWNVAVMELLDRANTTSYGHPEPTKVRVTPIRGKAILVSGHDLKDLDKLLQQTAGKGINVYTHGEMLPCLAYPGLKKYPHLVGNYGSAWQNQREEFDAFPGAVLMTTNCIQKPKDSYKGRIFTTGLVAWPGVTHIGPDKDFTPVIEAALAAPGFTADEPAHEIMIGFARNAVMNAAGKVIELVKAGKIRHFFLIGGCDGAKPGRSYYTDFAKAVPPGLRDPDARVRQVPLQQARLRRHRRHPQASRLRPVQRRVFRRPDRPRARRRVQDRRQRPAALTCSLVVRTEGRVHPALAAAPRDPQHEDRTEPSGVHQGARLQGIAGEAEPPAGHDGREGPGRDPREVMTMANDSLAKGTPFDIAGLTAYQPDSVVSRTIIDRPVGTVTSFAFDKGQALSEHAAPYDALVLVTDGSVEIAIGGEPRTVSAGQGIIMPANVTHALKALTPFKMTLVMIRA